MQSEGVCAREKGQRRSVQRAEKESRKPHAFWKMVYGKIFRKPFYFSVNRFPQFTKRFSDQITDLFC